MSEDSATPARSLVGRAEELARLKRLVAQGRSNRLIAEQLFISAKTVSVHVSTTSA